MERATYASGLDAFSGQAYSPSRMRGEDSASHMGHLAQPPLSPRLHSLPDNVLSPLGLLAEASLHNSDKSKRAHGHTHLYSPSHNGTAPHRPSPLSMNMMSDTRTGAMGRSGRAMTPNSYRMATSDVRGGEADGQTDEARTRGVASENYFKPGQANAATRTPGVMDTTVSFREGLRGGSQLNKIGSGTAYHC
jgi:hypothetical protein